MVRAARLTLPLVLAAIAAPSARADYRPFEVSPSQDAVLERVLARARPGAVVVFDLDSTLLDNRPRQVAILRAWAAREGLVELEGLAAHHLQDWDLPATLRRAGVAPERVEELAKAARGVWRREFWDDARLVHDLPLPGAAAWVRRLREAGATIAYVGRRTSQEAGTRATLTRCGFPLDGEGATFIPDEVPGGGRDEGGAARARTLEAVSALGEVVAAFDNEGPRVDELRARWPEAVVVQVRTDGPQWTRTQGPWVRGFLTTSQPVPEPSLAGARDVPEAGQPLEVVAVADGDTVTVRDAEGTRYTIRLIGIDTPEKDGLYDQPFMADKRRRHLEAYGPRVVGQPGAWEDARAFLQERLADRRVLLRYDPANLSSGHRDTTSSRRVLAYVHALGDDGVEIDINAELCARGFTLDYGGRYPHVRMEEFTALIREARRRGLGYWGPRYQAH